MADHDTRREARDRDAERVVRKSVAALQYPAPRDEPAAPPTEPKG